MTGKLLQIDGQGTDPDLNMGLEEYLLVHTGSDESILYLWQNERTVVIGRNQNAWNECRVESLLAAGGRLARRLSGGGAVFHDLGNINFTFLARKDNFDTARQTQVILEAVKSFGVNAVRTGRNDLVIDGKKISGHAFYQAGDCCYHHGTILLSSDTEMMTRYLTVSRAKLCSKSVDSVKSRVANLCDYIPGVTPQSMRERLIGSFSAVYGLPVERFPKARLDDHEIAKRAGRFASWEWKYGRKIPFTDQISGRFAWGEVQIMVRAAKGRIEEADICTDALDIRMSQKIKERLSGARWMRDEIRQRVESIQCENPTQEAMRRDMLELIGRMVD